MILSLEVAEYWIISVENSAQYSHSIQYMRKWLLTL